MSGPDGTPESSQLRETSEQLFFIVGCGRSGTTLLQTMLMAGGAVSIPMETKFYDAFPTGRAVGIGDPATTDDLPGLVRRVHEHQRRAGIDVPPDRFVALAEEADRTWDGVFLALMAAYREKEGGVRVGEKSPAHTRWVPRLAAAFPDAKFVHLMRDPRAVALSRIRAGFTTKRTATAIERWREAVAMHENVADSLGGDRYFLVRYEDLVTTPKEAIEPLCAFLGIPFDERMLTSKQGVSEGLGAKAHHQNLAKPVFTSSIEKWRKELTTSQIRMIEAELGETMRAFGYEPDDASPGGAAHRLRFGASLAAGKLDRLLAIGANAARKILRKKPSPTR